MAQPVIAEPEVDLHTVALGLQAAGYTITSVLQTRMTVGMLPTTTNPVIVLLNDQALQCILVELVSEQNPLDSSLPVPLTSETPGEWRAIARSLAALALEGPSDGACVGDVLTSEQVRPVVVRDVPMSFAQGMRRAPTRRPTLRVAAQCVTNTVAALNRAYVTLPGAVAHYVTLALLGGFTGYILHSIWLLPVVPLVYVSTVAIKIMWRAPSAGGAPHPPE